MWHYICNIFVAVYRLETLDDMRRKVSSRHSLLEQKHEVKVLMVDDNEELRNLYAMHISNNGFEVKTACDGEDALQILSEFIPKVIILDISMPNMDGIQLLRVLKQTPGLVKIPVIMLTAREEFLSYCLNAGASSYVRKGANSAKELLTQISMLTV